MYFHASQSRSSRLFLISFCRFAECDLNACTPARQPDRSERRAQQIFLPFALAALLLICGTVAAQVNPGHPNWSAYDSHEVDTINLQNLNVALHVPVMSKNGAIPFTFSVIGGNSFVNLQEGTELEPGFLAVPLTGAANGILGGQQTLVEALYNAPFTCANGTGTAQKFSQFVLHFADGTQHPFPVTDSVVTSTDGYPGDCPTSFSDTTIDGSGYTVSVTGCTSDIESGCYIYAVNSLYDRSGMSISTNAFPATVTDSNGNKMSYNITTGVYTDTLGLTALTISNPTEETFSTVSWTDVAGGSPEVSPTNTSYTLRSAFGCSGKTDYDLTSQSFDLPPISVHVRIRQLSAAPSSV
jgi:hypothetical protein